jgi:hypothetical protein
MQSQHHIGLLPSSVLNSEPPIAHLEDAGKTQAWHGWTQWFPRSVIKQDARFAPFLLHVQHSREYMSV